VYSFHLKPMTQPMIDFWRGRLGEQGDYVSGKQDSGKIEGPSLSSLCI